MIWAETTLTGEAMENIDQERFNNIANYVFEQRLHEFTPEMIESMYENASGSTIVEKG
jgi:hypothetical protein